MGRVGHAFSTTAALASGLYKLLLYKHLHSMGRVGVVTLTVATQASDLVQQHICRHAVGQTVCLMGRVGFVIFAIATLTTKLS